MTPTLYVSAFDPKTGTASERAVEAEPPRCDLWFDAVPGASAIHVLLRVGRSSVRAEFEVDTEGPLRLGVEWNEKRILGLSSDSRSVSVLPSDPRYAPPTPLQPARNDRKLDLIFLIDGTTKIVDTFKDPGTRKSRKGIDAFTRLLDDKNSVWKGLVQKLVLFASEMAKQYPEMRTGVLVFGDYDTRFIASAPDLLCRYLIYPEDPDDRKLRTYSQEELERQFMDLPSSPGGDFIDALADGLEACARCGWRKNARHLLMLCGDSPGFSLLKAAPAGADIQVRRLDVMQEALRLHAQHGVEIACLYLGVPATVGDNPYGASQPRPFLEYARNQYRRLASPNLFWEGPGFEPMKAVEAVQAVPEMIARGPCYGLLVPEPVSPLETVAAKSTRETQRSGATTKPAADSRR